jgi:putative CocE/NonD family hydrolase
MSTTIVDENRRLAAERQYGPLGPHGVSLTDKVTVTVDDGVELTGILALPDGIGRVPAVLIRTPYEVDSFPPEATELFLGEVIVWASHGYACLVQSTRTTASYFSEAADGAATVRWLEKQPWFDGRLGLTGDSYHAFTSWAIASTRPAAVKAMATGMYSTDRVSSWYPGGGFGLELALNWAAIQQTGGGVGADPYGHLPLDQADAAAIGVRLDFYQERLAHDGTDAHWRPLDFSALLDDLPVPLLHVDGWYDYHRTYFWQDFERLNRSASDVPYRFVVGPWPHASYDRRIAMAEKLAWFDTYVRGEGGARFGALRYYRTGVDAGWVERQVWDEPEAIVWYADADDRLATAHDDQALRVGWTYDPADPTPAVGFVTLGVDAVGDLTDNSALEERADVRVFTSAELREPMELAGCARAVTTFFSDAPSADLFLRILDVHGDGRVQNVADGILRVTDPGLTDGVRVEVDLGPVGHRFGAGHRLRLLVASGAHPYYNRNLGNGEPIATATRLRVARQEIAVGGENGLHLVLPVSRPQ